MQSYFNISKDTLGRAICTQKASLTLCQPAMQPVWKEGLSTERVNGEPYDEMDLAGVTSTLVLVCL